MHCSPATVRQTCICIHIGKSGLPRSGKNLENEIFSRSGKSQGILERTWKVREKSGNLKINGCGRQSSEKLFILFKRGKDVHSHEIA